MPYHTVDRLPHDVALDSKRRCDQIIIDVCRFIGAEVQRDHAQDLNGRFVDLVQPFDFDRSRHFIFSFFCYFFDRFRERPLDRRTQSAAFAGEWVILPAGAESFSPRTVALPAPRSVAAGLSVCGSGPLLWQCQIYVPGSPFGFPLRFPFRVVSPGNARLRPPPRFTYSLRPCFASGELIK